MEITLGRVSDTRAATETVRYQERLRVPLWWCLPAFLLAVIIAYEVNLGVRSLPDWLPYALLLPVAAAVLVWLLSLIHI